MSKNAYITSLGRSSWALINTYYYVLKDNRCIPDVVYVLAEEPSNNRIEKILQSLKILSEEFDINPEIKSIVVGDAKIALAGEEVYKIMKVLKDDDYKITLDITPGKKTLVAATLLSANKIIQSEKNAITNIFYLAVDEPLEPKPFMMIPLSAQNLRDFYDGQNGEK